jgi:hypothetical protein
MDAMDTIASWGFLLVDFLSPDSRGFSPISGAAIHQEIAVFMGKKENCCGFQIPPIEKRLCNDVW